MDHSAQSSAPSAGRPETGRTAITASQIFDDRRTSRFAVATIFGLTTLLVGAVGWASVMPLAEISTSSGEVVPARGVFTVQHLEGGIVSSVPVEEGEMVEKGQTLLVLAPTIAATELSQLRTRYAAAQVRIDLLSAALRGDLPEGQEIPSEHRAIVSAEIRDLRARTRRNESQVSVLRQQMAERRAELATLDARQEAFVTQIEFSREKIAAQRRLLEGGNFPRLQILDEERGLARMLGDAAEMQSEKIRLAERIREAEARIVELGAIFEAELTSEISALTKEAAELELTISQAEDRVGRLTVSAPVAGRVQDLQVHSGGSVVAPGATILSIVPADAELRVEARVSTADVGHVKSGQPVEVKVQTYDFSRFGKVDGRITQISPTTFLDPDGRPYFRATIDLDSTHVGADETLALAPGMTVTADIVTGQRTLLNYLATPILKSLDTGLHER